MADRSLESVSLPLEVRARLAELELELSEGDITQKGYEKKRSKLIGAYLPQPPAANGAAAVRCRLQHSEGAARRMLRTANIGVCDIREAAARERAASTAGNRPLFYFRFGEHNECIFSSPYLSVTVPHLEASGRHLHQDNRLGAASDKAGQPKDDTWKVVTDFYLPKSEEMGKEKK